MSRWDMMLFLSAIYLAWYLALVVSRLDESWMTLYLLPATLALHSLHLIQACACISSLQCIDQREIDTRLGTAKDMQEKAVAHRKLTFFD